MVIPRNTSMTWKKSIRMKTSTAILCALVLAGCTTSPTHIYPGLFGQRVVGNSVSVAVSNLWNEMDGLPLADSHCDKFGKAARFTNFSNHTATYDCVLK